MGFLATSKARSARSLGVGLYARVSTPHQHTIGMQLRQLREFLERRRWQEVLVVEEVCPPDPGGAKSGIMRDRLLSGPAASLRVIFQHRCGSSPSLRQASIQQWRGADAPVPAGVVPRYADRDVSQWASPSLPGRLLVLLTFPSREL